MDDATAPVPAAEERSEAEKDFLIKQSMVGELDEFFPPEFLDNVKARFEARHVRHGGEDTAVAWLTLRSGVAVALTSLYAGILSP